MKKLLLNVMLLCCLTAWTGISRLNAQTFNKDSLTANWELALGANDAVEAIASLEGAFSYTEFSIGSQLTCVGAQNANDGIVFSKFQPVTEVSGVTNGSAVAFAVKPVAGLTFRPTSISFQATRFGTDNGYIAIVTQHGENQVVTVASDLKPARNNGEKGGKVAPFSTSYTYFLADTVTSGEAFTLYIYVYGLGTNKQAGFCNVSISGIIDGSVAQVNKYTVSATPSIEGAGEISFKPSSPTYEEGTSLTLSASENFSYHFIQWSDTAGNLISTDNPYSFDVTGDLQISAVYEQVNTYEMKVNVDGGAKDYMISYSPEYTIVNGKQMYEEGTTVALTATNNNILTFTNWSTGETSVEKAFAMNADIDVTAYYSAIDYIVGWDFYKSGSGGRVADFASEEVNEASALILRNADGTTAGWLDKSYLAAGGYEGGWAAVNWKAIADKYYYQISFNAKNFTNIQVQSSMLYNYNAYSVQYLEYSLDGESWTKLDSFRMTAAKTWYAKTCALDTVANNKEKVYIRWIPDYTSTVVGSTSGNDGTSLSAIYVTGTAAIYDDGMAPVLINTVPADSAEGISASGKIVLTYDEKIQVLENTSATLGNLTLIPRVSGKTLIFEYKGLEYSTAYVFEMPAGTVSDLAGNTNVEAVEIAFSTMNRPTVAKKAFDFVVGVDGDFAAAITAANSNATSGKRFYIFFPDGEYNIGELTGDANQMTSLSLANISYVGQSEENTVLYNKSTQEAINSTATIYLTSSSDNIYMQDLSLMNKMDYRTGQLIGRGVALWNQGDRNIFKNVRLLSCQDTYYSGSDRAYFENGEIHGTVDFICGGGDHFFNQVLLYLEERSGNCITAPATAAGGWGYVFSSCTIDGFSINQNNFRLGRPWSNEPKATYINTTMIMLPTSTAWGDPMNVVPKQFAEYNSMTVSGAAIDLSTRRSSYTKDDNMVVLNPVLTAGQAAEYTIDNVLGGNDDWQPQVYTEQSAAPLLALSDSTISWNTSNYVLCWVVFKDGVYDTCVVENRYVIPEGTANGTVFSVRAANEMGGLGESVSVTYTSTGIKTMDSNINEESYYDIYGRQLTVPGRGINIVRTVKDGKVTTRKIIVKE